MNVIFCLVITIDKIFLLNLKNEPKTPMIGYKNIMHLTSFIKKKKFFIECVLIKDNLQGEEETIEE